MDAGAHVGRRALRARALTASTAITAALASWGLATRVVGPVRTLDAASRRVSRGDYATRVTATGEDEITVLAGAFNEMSASLASAEDRRRRLLADLAHELRTPLATVDAYLEGLADGVVTSDPETWHVLRAETARLRRLADDIAAVSRAEERQLDLRLRRIDPRELLAAAAKASRPAYVAKGVRLVLDASRGAPAVAVDCDRLGEILGNLLDNALDHTPQGGTVRLAASRDDGDAVLSVTDTGDGLDPDDLERIFERFYRADPARARGGSGIGLTIARALAEAHGGALWAESAGRGHGARFVVRLPGASRGQDASAL